MESPFRSAFVLPTKKNKWARKAFLYAIISVCVAYTLVIGVVFSHFRVQFYRHFIKADGNIRSILVRLMPYIDPTLASNTESYREALGDDADLEAATGSPASASPASM